MLTPQILPSNETPLYGRPVGVCTVFSNVGRWLRPGCQKAQQRRRSLGFRLHSYTSLPARQRTFLDEQADDAVTVEDEVASARVLVTNDGQQRIQLL